MNIIFTCAGRRNYLINYFKKALNGEGQIFAADMTATAPALAEADKAFVLPKVNELHYFKSLLKVVRENDADAIISLNDLELPLLADKKSMLKNEGITAVVSSPAVIETCFDKYKTNIFAQKLGIKVPKTYRNITAVQEDLKKGALAFPLVLKPCRGSASIGLNFVDDEKGLDLAYESLKHVNGADKSQKSLSDNESEAVLIQKKMEGDEYGLDIINDLEGNHVSVVVKRKMAMRAGETDKAMTVKNTALAQIGRQIGKELKHVGNLDCDFFEVDGEYYLLEMNPRFGGGYPFSHEAGVDLPKAILSWLRGEKAPARCFEYEDDRLFAKCDRLITIPDDLDQQNDIIFI